MQIKIPIKYQVISIGMTVIKIQRLENDGNEKVNPSILLVVLNYYQHY